jgi:hypothetical protein
MTGGAPLRRSCLSHARRVLRVVKLCIEASQAGEFFERRILLGETSGLMADPAQGAAGGRELCLVTTDAVFVFGKLRL